jgi:hypothetical protein
MCGRFTFQPTEAFYDRFQLINRLDGLNRSIRDWYTHAATFVCSSAAMFSTAAVTAGS